MHWRCIYPRWWVRGPWLCLSCCGSVAPVAASPAAVLHVVRAQSAYCKLKFAGVCGAGEASARTAGRLICRRCAMLWDLVKMSVIGVKDTL